MSRPERHPTYPGIALSSPASACSWPASPAPSGPGKCAARSGNRSRRLGAPSSTRPSSWSKPIKSSALHTPAGPSQARSTSCSTWGVFGLIAGGLQGLWVWGILARDLGCARRPHRTPREQGRAQAGRQRLPPDSSAIAIFVQGSDPHNACSPRSGPSSPAPRPGRCHRPGPFRRRSMRATSSRSSPPERSGAAPAPSQTTLLSMLLVRFAGEHGAKKALGDSVRAKHPDLRAPQVELMVEANKEGRRRVVNPTTGTAVMAKSDIIGWGVCGVVWGAIVGFVGGAGALGIDSMTRCSSGSRGRSSVWSQGARRLVGRKGRLGQATQADRCVRVPPTHRSSSRGRKKQ